MLSQPAAVRVVSEGLGIIAGLVIGSCIPSIRFTFYNGEFGSAVVIDGEVERIDLRTTIFVVVSVQIGSRRIMYLSVPFEALTGDFCACRVMRVVDGQIEGIYLCTSVGIIMRVIIGA